MIKLYKIKLKDSHTANPDQMRDGYLASDGNIMLYTWGEALAKTCLFNGQIELASPLPGDDQDRYIKGNILIAEYMGLAFCFNKTDEPRYSLKANRLSYHCSWDSLIPAAAKITSTCEFDDYPEKSRFWDEFTQMDIEKTWHECVEFIKWLNKVYA